MKFIKKALFLCLTILCFSMYGQDEKSTLLLNSDYHRQLNELYDFEQWTPTDEDISKADVAIQQLIDDNLFDFMETKPSLQDIHDLYYRQYAPILNDNKDKIIIVNAFCNDAVTKDWKEEAVLRLDGGTCFWRMYFNVDTLEISYFNINND